MNNIIRLRSGLAGLQWLFFLFTNTVVIPIMVGAAFALPQDKIQFLIQCSFVLTGLACVVQAAFGHQRSVMEGQSGLWWGVILSLSAAAPSLGISLTELGGSLAAGIVISGIITILICVCGLASPLSKLFTPGVMAVFMFLLGCRLNMIFLEGMLGISSGSSTEATTIQPTVFLLSAAVAVFVAVLSVKARPAIGQYALLIGILGGWVLYTLIFGRDSETSSTGTLDIGWFPLGDLWHGLNIGVVMIAIIAGLVNASNTFGALKETDHIYEQEASDKQYRRSFTISGVFAVLSGLLGLVPYAPYVSSVGFLQQTRIRDRLPFVIGGLLFTGNRSDPGNQRFADTTTAQHRERCIISNISTTTRFITTIFRPDSNGCSKLVPDSSTSVRWSHRDGIAIGIFRLLAPTATSATRKWSARRHFTGTSVGSTSLRFIPTRSDACFKQGSEAYSSNI